MREYVARHYRCAWAGPVCNGMYGPNGCACHRYTPPDPDRPDPDRPDPDRPDPDRPDPDRPDPDRPDPDRPDPDRPDPDRPDPDRPDPDGGGGWESLPDGTDPSLVPGELKFERPDYEFPSGGIVIPQRINDGFTRLRDRFTSFLGLGKLSEEIKRNAVSTSDFKIVIENPFQNFAGNSFPAMRAELDFGELAKQSWVPLVRTVLLFMIIWMFISAVIGVLIRT